MKKIRKLTSLFLVLAMSLALAIPCFAAEPEEDEQKNVIYLEMGETYIDPETGYKISFLPSESISEAEKNAARNGIAPTGMIGNTYYYAKDVEIGGAYFHTVYNTNSHYGGVLVAHIDNEPLTDGYVEVILAHTIYKPAAGYVLAGRAGDFKIESNNGFGIDGDVEFTLIGHPTLHTWFSVYQYYG